MTRPALPERVIEACERVRGPTLIYDLTAIAATMRAVASAARAVGIRALFAAKSFPHPVVRALAGELLDGFDVAAPAEIADVVALGVRPGQIVSVGDPRGVTAATAPPAAGWRGRLIIGCETPDQVAAAPAHAEIAIRLSLGATPSDVMRLAIRQGLILTGLGIAIGLSIAFALTRFLGTLLHGVEATDPVTFASVTLLFVGIASVASWLPARRAAGVDPSSALRIG